MHVLLDTYDKSYINWWTVVKLCVKLQADICVVRNQHACVRINKP